MEGSGGIITVVLAIIVGALGVLIFGKKIPFIKDANEDEGSDHIVEIEDDPVVIIEPDPRKEVDDKTPSSKEFIKKAREKLAKIFGSSTMLLFILIISVSIFGIEKKDQKFIEDYFEKSGKYVEIVEEELSILRYDKREDTKIEVKVIEKGTKLKVKVTIPTMQPVMDDKEATKKKAEPIERNFTIGPKISVKRIRNFNGIYLFTGILIGASYDFMEEEVKSRLRPMAGLEIVSLFHNPYRFAGFAYIDTLTFGFGVGIAPLDGPNIGFFLCGGKSYLDRSYRFGAGISAIIKW